MTQRCRAEAFTRQTSSSANQELGAVAVMSLEKNVKRGGRWNRLCDPSAVHPGVVSNGSSVWGRATPWRREGTWYQVVEEPLESCWSICPEGFNLTLINSLRFQARIELCYMAMPLCRGLLHVLWEIWFIHLAYCWRWLERSSGRNPQNWFLTIPDSLHSSLTLLQINLKQSLSAAHVRLLINSHNFFRKLFLSHTGVSFKVGTSPV